MSQRLFIAILMGLLSMLVGRLLLHGSENMEGDLFFAICAALEIVQGNDPYSSVCTMQAGVVSYPFTTLMYTVPFALLPRVYVARAMFGLSVALLTYGALHDGKMWRLLLFLSPPFYETLIFSQWTPLLMAVLYCPRLLPLTLLKPHIGLPIFVTRANWPGIVATAAFGLLSLILYPTWPWRWLSQITEYRGFIPLLILPAGLLLPLALWHWRSQSARLLVCMALVPQRAFYDALLLWWIPQTAGQMIALTLMSWLGYSALLLGWGWGLYAVIVVSMYVPALLIIFWQRRHSML